MNSDSWVESFLYYNMLQLWDVPPTNSGKWRLENFGDFRSPNDVSRHPGLISWAILALDNLGFQAKIIHSVYKAVI